MIRAVLSPYDSLTGSLFRQVRKATGGAQHDRSYTHGAAWVITRWDALPGLYFITNGRRQISHMVATTDSAKLWLMLNLPEGIPFEETTRDQYPAHCFW